MKTVVRPETEMKNSGIEYIGKIPNDWEVRKAGYLAAKITDYVASGSFATLAQNVQYLDEPDYARLIRTVDLSESVNKQPVYVSKEAYKFLSNSNLFGGELILPNIGSVGCVYQYKKIYEHATLAPNSILLDMKENNRFYFYWFSNPIVGESLKMLGNSTVQVKFNKSQLRQYMLPRPPLSEQQAIADYLDETCSKIDEIIAEAKASIVEYKELRESVISNATTRGIKKNRCMKPSGVEWLPEIPSDWNVLSPKVVFAQRKDRAIKGERQLTASQKHGIMYQDDYMKEEGVRIVTVEKDFSILKHVEPDDFVISMRSFQGGLEYSYLRGCISSAYVMLIPNHKYVYSEYYKWFFKSDKYINALQSTSDLIRDGQALRYANFVKLKLFDIPIEEQKEIADYLNKEVPKIDSLIAEKESLINDLEAYKKSLIYEVVTGKRRVV